MEKLIEYLQTVNEIVEERKSLKKLDLTDEEIEGYFEFYFENYFPPNNKKENN